MDFYRQQVCLLSQPRMGRISLSTKHFVYIDFFHQHCATSHPLQIGCVFFFYPICKPNIYKCRPNKMMAITCEWFCCWLRHVSYSAINYNFGVVFCSSPEPPNYDTIRSAFYLWVSGVFFLCNQQQIRGEVHNIFISLYIPTNALLGSVLI